MRLPRSFTALLPPRARRVDDAGASTFSVRGRPCLRVYWHAERGAPCWALELDREGRTHGREREWRADGRLFYDARWEHGVQHGLQRMWRADGTLVVRTRFVHGTGLDAWFPQEGALCAQGETRPFVDGERHGPERHWESATRVWREEWFSRGVEHGITREWSGTRLARGYPRFLVRGERVDRRAYARACARDASLPPWTERDDRPTRARPPIVERGR